jgi:MOSC domain-containing protein YiiM
MPTLTSVQVGLPKERIQANNAMEDSNARTWHSGIFKSTVTERVWMGALNIAGDGQADLKHHGGPDRAALMYCAAHYAYWRQVLPEVPWEYGGFGENLTVTELNEETTCLGDIYQIGEARVQVTQPRQPCWKLARRWQIKDLAARVDENKYSGWYVRTLTEGHIQAGDAITLLERPHPNWSINTVRYVVYHLEDHPKLTAELAEITALSADWHRYLAER